MPESTPTTTPTALPAAPNPNHARGVLEAVEGEHITLAIPGTSYQLLLKVLKAPATPIGKRLIGTIRATARRVDIVNTGGRYIEPVYGRPRRVQGRIDAIDTTNHTITVQAGIPIVCTLMKSQHNASFKVGDLVSFDVEPGASFIPAT
ncbi:MAG: hypothetical protein ACTS3F_10410 [Phycisphaerales bacterium]